MKLRESTKLLDAWAHRARNVDDFEQVGTLEHLLTRHSVGPKHLLPPVPTDDQLWLAAGAALRGPDHHKLVPFRFVVIPDDTRPQLAQLFADFACRQGKGESEIAAERERAGRAPMLIAFTVRIDGDHPTVRPREQWLAAGGALANFLSALHVMGFGAKVLSGRKVDDEAISQAFCENGESLVGWIAVGTASLPPHPRHNDSPEAVLRKWKPLGGFDPGDGREDGLTETRQSLRVHLPP